MTALAETPAAVLRRVMNTPWPPSREAQWAIGWAALTLWDALMEGDAEQAADCALALENQLARYKARHEAEAHILVRQVAGGAL